MCGDLHHSPDSDLAPVGKVMTDPATLVAAGTVLFLLALSFAAARFYSADKGRPPYSSMGE